MKEKDIYTYNENIFQIMDKEAAVLTAGTSEAFNSMVIGWATIGFMWRRNVLTVFVRPSRYTFKFLSEQQIFTLSFFSRKYRDKLSYIGNHSGRDEDKVKKCNLTPIFTKENGVSFAEARLVFVCRKIYEQDLIPENIPEPINTRFYQQKEYHRMFVGEIIQVLENEE
jgi:flavin reductase (DIM6/NTAB) family NADH-FMN oxidoreductase RutF